MVGVGRDFKDHPVPTSLSLDQVAQRSSQPCHTPPSLTAQAALSASWQHSQQLPAQIVFCCTWDKCTHEQFLCCFWASGNNDQHFTWLLNLGGFCCLMASGHHQGKVLQMRFVRKKSVNLFCSFYGEMKTHIKIRVFYFMGMASKCWVSRTESRSVVK